MMDLPKNIRQIGESDRHNCIYVEDYVITYLHQLEIMADTGSRAAVLFGKSEKREQKNYYYIYGAVCGKGTRLEDERTIFDEEEREYIEARKKEYFQSFDVLGIAIVESEFNSVSESGLWNSIRKEFGNENKLLFKINPATDENRWKICQNGMVNTIGGYAIFYDSNEMMQTYLIAWNKEREGSSVEEVSDRAAHKFRAMIMERQEANDTKRIMPIFYTVTILLMITFCVMGVTAVNHYDKMMRLELAMTKLAEAMQEKNDVETVSNMDEEVAEAIRFQEGQAFDGEIPSQLSETATLPELVALPEQETATEPTASMEQGTATEPAVSTEQGATTESTVPTEQETTTKSTASTEQGKVTDPAESMEQGVATESQEQETTTGETSADTYMEYYVKAGDTLAGISIRYYNNMNKVDAICRLNGIKDSNTIKIGQKILLP